MIIDYMQKRHYKKQMCCQGTSSMIDVNMKDKLYELQGLLNSIAPYENLHSEKVLEISRELDSLIIKSYSGNEESEEENKI